MRVLAVRGVNLASLEAPFEVSLDSGLLGRTGLFAITGPTGAGKSTLLDAICLCLYDKTPRLRGGGKHLQVSSSGTATLASGDRRSILRQGAPEGWAEVDFRGRQGQEWTARWRVWRSRGRADGNIRGPDWSLRRRGDPLEALVAGGGLKEVESAIEDRVGLKFDQFRRSVLLAQGDFAAFLRAKDTERAELLEQMTGTQIYSKLSIRAHRHNVDRATKRKALCLRQGEHPVLEPAARLGAEEAVAAAAAHKQAATKDHQAARTAADWHAKDRDLRADLRIVETSHRKALAALEEARPRRARWQATRTAWPLRTQAAAVAEAAAQATAAQTAATAADATRTDAVAARDTAVQALEVALADHAVSFEALRDQLQARHDRATGARDAALATLDAMPHLVALHHRGALADHPGKQSLHPKLRVHASLLAQLQELDSALAATRVALAEAAEAVAQSDKDVQETTTARRLAEADAAEKLAAVTALEASDPAGEQAALAKLRTRWSVARHLAVETQRLSQERAAARAEHDARRQRAGERAAPIERLKAQLQSSRAALKQAHRSAHNARVASDSEALRSGLVDGEPCPVCGAEHHPWADGSPLAAALQALDAEVDRQQAKVETLQSDLAGELAAAQEDHKASLKAEAQVQKLDEELMATDVRWTAACTEGPEEIRALAEQPRTDRTAAVAGLGEVLDTRDNAARRAVDALDTARRIHRASEASAHAARAGVEAAQAAAQARQKKAAALPLEKQRLTGERTATEKRRTSLAEDLAEGLDAVKAELSDAPEALQALATWRADLAAPEPLLTALEAADTHLADLHSRHERALAALAELGDALPDARARADLAVRAAPDSVLSLRRAARPPEPEDRSPPTTTQRLRTAAAESESHVARCRAAQAQTQAAATQAESTAQAKRTKALTHQQTATDLAERLTQAAAAAELDGPGLAALIALPQDWVQTEETALDALDTEAKAQAVRLEERTRARRTHSDTRPAVDAEDATATLAAAEAELTAADERWNAARTVLSADDTARTAQAKLTQELAAHDAQAAPWSALAATIGSASGQTFRRFAQSLTFELLLAQTNHHLRRLHPRYRLARIAGTDLDMLVVDRDLGDEPRTIQSLSGGEGFLVSLALALGLSTLASQDVRIQSLFIDEGFGTLDARSLDTALAVLDSLQAEGRQVGVISHVGGLAERIGAQVAVSPLGGGRSEVRTVGTETT